MKYLKTTKPVTCYLASGWFNEPQEQARQEILKVLEDNEISYFSPKDEVEVKFDATHEERQAAFKADTEVSFEPTNFLQMAGMLLYLNDKNYIYAYITHDEEKGKVLYYLNIKKLSTIVESFLL